MMMQEGSVHRLARVISAVVSYNMQVKHGVDPVRTGVDLKLRQAIDALTPEERELVRDRLEGLSS